MRRKPIVKSLLYVLSASAVISAGHVYVSHADGLDNGNNNNVNAATVNANNANGINNLLGSQLTADNFISTISPVAQTIANNNNLYASTMVAQAALESGYGTSYLTQVGNNLFGIKSFDNTGVKLKTVEYNSNGQAYNTYAYFKSYNSIMDSLQGYATFLTVNSRYANVFKSQSKDGIEAAVNIQKDGYATDPSYASKLINLINTYNLTSLDGNTSSTNTTPSTNNSNNNNQTPAKPKKTLATATYTYGNPLETFQLSSTFTNYNMYTHVKDTTQKNVSSKWPSHLKAGSNVYVDSSAVRTYKGSSTNWYRIKTSKNAKSYWVSGKAIDFPTINIRKDSGKIKLSHANKGLYSNVFNSPTLAKELGSSNSYKGKTFNVNEIATYNYHGKENVWYRIHIANLGNVWVNKDGITYTKAEKKKAVKKTTKKKVTKKKAKKVVKKKKTTAKKSTYSKASGHAYLNNYGKFSLYNHIPGTYKHVQKTSWAQVKVPKDYKVSVNLKGIRTEYHTTWYRIILNHKNYWISAKSLLFY